MNRRGLLVVVSGPSGVGKDTVLHRLFELDPSLSYSVSYTTRQPRPGEVDGRDYSFVDDAEFDRMIVGGDLLEWEPVHTHRSGTGKSRVESALQGGLDIVLNIDVKGGVEIRRLVADPLLVFLAPPSLEELDRRRLTRGTEGAAELAQRASDAQIEMGYSDQYDAIVVNGDVDRAAREVLNLIQQRRGTTS
ncbi:MAG TPA: guanylate kinase [Candidatus Dormibacteraeota bacterium]|nr:guanylate kinase [Candidatus Dormibacteraeota bacterium]